LIRIRKAIEWRALDAERESLNGAPTTRRREMRVVWETDVQARMTLELCEARAEIERLQRLLAHATHENPVTSTLVMLINEASEAKAELAFIKAEYGEADPDGLLLQANVLKNEINNLRKLAYLGDHHFPDLTYKARLEELVAEHRQTQAQLENALDTNQEGAWMARALDAERERDALKQKLDDLSARYREDVESFDGYVERSSSKNIKLREENERLRREIEALRDVLIDLRSDMRELAERDHPIARVVYGRVCEELGSDTHRDPGREKGGDA
jgi:DNA repair exonuclease SbcCD ATPase subunit